MSKTRISVLVAMLIVGLMLIGGVYYRKTHTPTVQETQSQITEGFALKSIRLLPTGDFELVSKSGTRVKGCLRGAISPEGKDEVVRLLNSAQKGRVEVVQKQGGVWVVDIFLTIGDVWKEVSLWDWAVQKKLTYQIPGPEAKSIEEAKEKLDKLIRHINNVQEATALLGRKLIDKGEIELGISLTAIGFTHDQSKFAGIEWDYLVAPEEFNGEAKLAARHHARTNRHHPEAWGSVDLMPRLYVAEMTADFYARATEFGTDVWDYVKEKAMPRYGISPHGKIYKWIKEFLDLLLEKPFVQSPVDDVT